jgi:dolichyl-phosphate beta-glucosyltransferase
LPLACWYDKWAAQHKAGSKSREKRGPSTNGTSTAYAIEAAEVAVTVVVPAYNEEERLTVMLDEAVAFLDAEYPSRAPPSAARQRKQTPAAAPTGWEILVVSDGSTDATVATALDFARARLVPASKTGGSIRAVALERNRGKGGAVTHGMRHARGELVLFADADGASRFADLRGLAARAEGLAEEDPRGEGRAVVVGSRAHLVGSEAVVKASFTHHNRRYANEKQRSLLRNALMYAFHVFIWLLTTRRTSRVGDTQCGFKLFSRASLPYVVPYMHSEGWIFDVEMLMLTEAAGIPMAEEPVGWREVEGSKLNVVWASLGMAWGLLVIRGAWGMGIWKRL